MASAIATSKLINAPRNLMEAPCGCRGVETLLHPSRPLSIPRGAGAL
jgi:hypothetical protein